MFGSLWFKMSWVIAELVKRGVEMSWNCVGIVASETELRRLDIAQTKV